MIDVTGGGKVYGVNRAINEIIINGKPWEELKDEVGYIKKFADIDGNKVDLKLGCKELNRDLYTGLIETTDGRKWIRKYAAPRPFFVPSGTDWIFLFNIRTTAKGSPPYNVDSNWIRFHENVDICVITFHEERPYPYHNQDTIYYISDHFVAYDTFTASTNGYTVPSAVSLSSNDGSPDSFGAAIVENVDDPANPYFKFEYAVPSLTVNKNGIDVVLYPRGNTNSKGLGRYNYKRENQHICLCEAYAGPYISTLNFPYTPRIINPGYRYEIIDGLVRAYNDDEFIDLLYDLYNSPTDDEILHILDLMAR